MRKLKKTLIVIRSTNNMEGYLENIKKLFDYYKLLGEKSMKRLTTDELNHSPNQSTNSIAVIVKHLRGNMLSRWTDFLTTDGEKTWRSRDKEFTNDPISKEEVLSQWSEGWTCLYHALNSISSEDLFKIIYIRNEGQSVLDAINRQLAHYSYHVGQIVFIAKQLYKADWESLSIPKNTSEVYNEEKFRKEKGVKSFIDDEIKKL